MAAYDDTALFDAVVELGILSPEKLEAARAEAQTRQVPLETVFLDRDLIPDEYIGQIIANIYSVPYVRLSQVSIPDEILHIIPEVVARKREAICFDKDAHGVKLATVHPDNAEFAAFLSKKTGDPVQLYYVTPRDLDGALSYYKRDLKHSFNQLLADQIAQSSTNPTAPVTKIVDLLIEYAYANRSSDIHIEPEKKTSLVRFRIDGVLHDVLELPKNLHDQVVSKIKVASRLRTDEKLAAQDGRMQAVLPQEDLDIRVSIVPIVNGEKVVLRLLSSKSRQFSLTDLGMQPEDLAKVESGFNKPYGMVLSTGPTGSGKTTSIYSILKILNTREVNIATIEDPVEYDVENINQIQVNPKTNLTFASGLRAILRQDPNVIFVGEIRDPETADIAVNSALTGHLVLSTLHTNDAATTLPRLIDMGIEPFLVASTVNVIIGQRLVRKICTKCRFSQDVPLTQITAHFPKDMVAKYFAAKTTARLYQGKGCPVCHQTGYQGRVGIFEVLETTEKLRELITAKADAGTITRTAVSEGMKTMTEDGLAKVLQGVTTIEEVLRVTRI